MEKQRTWRRDMKVMEKANTDKFLRFVILTVTDEHIPGGEQCK